MLEIKKLKIAKHLSEETIAFTAEVWFDGEAIAHARNHGTGGCTDVSPLGLDRCEAMGKAQAFARTKTWQFRGAANEHTLDTYIDELVGKHLERQDLRKQLRKLFGKRPDGSPAQLVGVAPEKLVPGGDCLIWKVPAAGGPTPSLLTAIRNKYPGVLILNELPEEEAVDVLLRMQPEDLAEQLDGEGAQA